MNAALQQIHTVLMSTHKGIEDFAFRTSRRRLTASIRSFAMQHEQGRHCRHQLAVGGIRNHEHYAGQYFRRIREIGIRKAVGASTSDIFTQIIIESVVIAMLGV